MFARPRRIRAFGISGKVEDSLVTQPEPMADHWIVPLAFCYSHRPAFRYFVTLICEWISRSATLHRDLVWPAIQQKPTRIFM
jgi:hypothetical protein